MFNKLACKQSWKELNDFMPINSVGYNNVEDMANNFQLQTGKYFKRFCPSAYQYIWLIIMIRSSKWWTDMSQNKQDSGTSALHQRANNQVNQWKLFCYDARSVAEKLVNRKRAFCPRQIPYSKIQAVAHVKTILSKSDRQDLRKATREL